MCYASPHLGFGSESALAKHIASLSSVKDILEFWNYPLEDHTVKTSDGYFLGIHRIPEGHDGATVYSVPKPYPKPTVLLWHGLGMSSELFLCNTSQKTNLALMLADNGYDVWMANTRGNKYSDTHETLKKTDSKFWDFSLDEISNRDVIEVVDYILTVTERRDLSIIGFEQGGMLALSSLANCASAWSEKINLVVSLGPCSLSNDRKNAQFFKSKTWISAVLSLASAFTSQLLPMLTRTISPSILFTLLGTKEFLSSVPMIQRYIPYFVQVLGMETTLKLLFDWNCENIGSRDKRIALYSHLYSTASVKNVVHWQQIKKEGMFRQYDSRYPSIVPQIFRSRGDHRPPTPVPTYQISDKVKVVIFNAEADRFGSIEHLKHYLPAHAEIIETAGFEILDFIWSDSANNQVWAKIMELLHATESPSRPLQRKIDEGISGEVMYEYEEEILQEVDFNSFGSKRAKQIATKVPIHVDLYDRPRQLGSLSRLVYSPPGRVFPPVRSSTLSPISENDEKVDKKSPAEFAVTNLEDELNEVDALKANVSRVSSESDIAVWGDQSDDEGDVNLSHEKGLSESGNSGDEYTYYPAVYRYLNEPMKEIYHKMVENGASLCENDDIIAKSRESTLYRIASDEILQIQGCKRTPPARLQDLQLESDDSDSSYSEGEGDATESEGDVSIDSCMSSEISDDHIITEEEVTGLHEDMIEKPIEIQPENEKLLTFLMQDAIPASNAPELDQPTNSTEELQVSSLIGDSAESKNAELTENCEDVRKVTEFEQDIVDAGIEEMKVNGHGEAHPSMNDTATCPTIYDIKVGVLSDDEITIEEYVEYEEEEII
ncbi:cholesterol esterase, partial [Nowakowskiella sp. JEL0407]